MMHGKVLAALICYCWVVSCAPQDDEVFNFSRRRSTTLDPIKAFFSNPIVCHNGEGVCIKECSDIALQRPDISCGPKLVCCSKETGSTDDDNGFVFPTRITTRPPATPKPRTRRPTTTTTTTTTTEEPDEEPFDPRDCGYGSIEDEDSSGLPIVDSYRGEFPWNVGIFTRETNVFGFNQDVFHCGGSIIHDFVVLTAASCVFKRKQSSLIVIAGVLNFKDNGKGRQERTLEQVVVHSSFKHTSQIYDVAFLFLSDKFDYSRTINRICLPRLGVDFKESNCLFTGWGEPKARDKVRPDMKTVRMELVESKSCQKTMRMRLSWHNSMFKLNESFQCAQEEDEINLSQMDLGSPLVCQVPGKQKQFYQVGIFATSQYVTGMPSMFTNVTFFRDWVDNQMGAFNLDPYPYIPNELDDE